MRNYDKKVEFLLADEDGALSRSSEFMKTCHNMNTIVQTAGLYVSSINGKIEIHNKTLANITRDIILNSSHNKELWCFAYHYDICLSCITQNRFHGDVIDLLLYGTRPPYKHIKIWDVLVYIINARVTIKKLDDISYCGYLMGYAATTGFII